MAISWKSTGTYVEGTANLTPGIPTASAGDLMLCFYGTKPYNDAPTINNSWTDLGSFTDGTIGSGIDTGSMQIRVFSKVHTGSESSPTITNTTNSVSGAVIIVFSRNTPGNWELQIGGGGDATAGTGFSVTSGNVFNVRSGDFIAAYAALRSDAATQSSISISGTGLTLATFTESPATDLTTASGQDMAMSGGYTNCTAGTLTGGALTYASTLGASHTGSAAIIRIREGAGMTIDRLQMFCKTLAMTQEGSGYEIGAGSANQPTIIGIDADSFIQCGITSTVRRIDWNGSAFSEGYSGTETYLQNGLIKRLSNGAFAYIYDNYNNPSLRKYAWNGSSHAQVGNGLSLSPSATFRGLIALNENTVAVWDSANNNSILKTYSFDGTNWSQVGNTFNAGTGVYMGEARGCKLTYNRILVPDVVNSVCRIFTWDGTNWTRETATTGYTEDLGYIDDYLIARTSGSTTLQLVRFNADLSSSTVQSITVDPGNNNQVIDGFSTRKAFVYACAYSSPQNDYAWYFSIQHSIGLTKGVSVVGVIFDTRAYNVTANAVGLLRNRKITIDQASFSVTTNALNFAKGKKLIIDVRSYSITTNPVLFDRSIIISSRAFTLTRNDVTLARGRRIIIDSATYTESTFPILFKRSMIISTRALNLSFSNILFDRSIRIDSRSYSLTNFAVNFARGKNLIFDTRAYTITTNNILVKRSIVISTRAYNLTFSNTLMKRSMVVSTLSLAYTTVPVGLLRGRRLTFDVRSYSLSTVAVNLLRGRRLTFDVRSYAATANAVGLLKGKTIAISTQSFTVTPNAISLLRGRRLVLDVSSYSTTPNAINFPRERRLTFDVQAYTVSAFALNFSSQSAIAIDHLALSLTPSPVNFLRGRVMVISTLSLAYTTQPVGFLRGRVMGVSVAPTTMQFFPLLVDRSMVIAPASLLVTTNEISLTYTSAKKLTFSPASFQVTPGTLTFVFGFKLQLSNLGLSWSSVGVSLLRSRRLLISVRSFSVGTFGIALQKPGAYQLLISYAQANLTVNDVNIRRGRRVFFSPRIFTSAFSPVGLTTGSVSLNVRLKSAISGNISGTSQIFITNLTLKSDITNGPI